MNPIMEAVQAGDKIRLSEVIKNASLPDLKAAYREILLSGDHPNVVRALEHAIGARQRLIQE